MSNFENENEDSWLYGQDTEPPQESAELDADPHRDEKDGAEKTETNGDNVERNVNGSTSFNNNSNSTDIQDDGLNNITNDGDDNNNNKNNTNADNGDDDDDDDEDSEEDDVQVTLGDIKSIYDSTQGKFQGPPGGPPIVTQIQANHTGGTSSKPPAKGVDVDAVGTVRGVPIYEFDLNSIKIDEKPWRKPGADITDYFNYGFTEDTWMKYCEKQRRMRLENNCKSGLIGNGQLASEPGSNDLDATYLGVNRRQGGPRQVIGNLGSGGMPKTTGVIDVIGGTLRDSRRPQQEFTDVPAASQSSATSVATVMPISMSIPPPLLNMPPPDFAIPPPSAIPPGALAHSVIGPPHGIIGHPQIMVAPPPNFAPPPIAGHQFDPFFRPPMMGGPPPTAVNHGGDRRAVQGFAERPPFRLESLYGAPPPFQGPTGMPPPHWESRKMLGHVEERPQQWGRNGSRSRESEISSSSTEETSRKSREKYETTDRKSPTYSRGDSRHRSRDRSSRRDYDRDKSNRDRDRDRDRRRGDYDSSSRSHHHSRHRGYRDEERSSRHYSSRSKRERSPMDDYHSSSKYNSKKHRHDRSGSSSASSDKDRRKSRSSTPEDHKK